MKFFQFCGIFTSFFKTYFTQPKPNICRVSNKFLFKSLTFILPLPLSISPFSLSLSLSHLKLNSLPPSFPSSLSFLCNSKAQSQPSILSLYPSVRHSLFLCDALSVALSLQHLYRYFSLEMLFMPIICSSKLQFVHSVVYEV